MRRSAQNANFAACSACTFVCVAGAADATEFAIAWNSLLMLACAGHHLQAWTIFSGFHAAAAADALASEVVAAQCRERQAHEPCATLVHLPLSVLLIGQDFHCE